MGVERKKGNVLGGPVMERDTGRAQGTCIRQSMAESIRTDTDMVVDHIRHQP